MCWCLGRNHRYCLSVKVRQRDAPHYVIPSIGDIQQLSGGLLDWINLYEDGQTTRLTQGGVSRLSAVTWSKDDEDES